MVEEEVVVRAEKEEEEEGREGRLEELAML